MKDYTKVKKELTKILGFGIKLWAGSNSEAGDVCVMQAINIALGKARIGDRKPVSDSSKSCVCRLINSISISINDSGCFHNNHDRGEVLKPLALAQLGTANKKEFKINKFRKLAAASLECSQENIKFNCIKEVEQSREKTVEVVGLLVKAIDQSWVKHRKPKTKRNNHGNKTKIKLPKEIQRPVHCQVATTV